MSDDYQNESEDDYKYDYDNYSFPPDTSQLPYESDGLNLVLKAFFQVLCFFGILANLLVILICGQERLRRRPSHMFLLALSIVDIVFLIDAVIQRIYELKDFPTGPFGKAFCKFLYGSDAFAQSASSLLLAAIAWDRTLLLFFPQKRTTLSAGVLIAFSCLFALCAALPRISHYKLASLRERVFDGYVNRTGCFPLIIHPETGEVVNDTVAAARFTFWSAIIGFTCSYLITAVHLIVLGTAIVARVTLVTREAITTHGNPQAIAYQRIVTYRILVLFSAFIVCHTPFWVMQILEENPSYMNAVDTTSPSYLAIMNGSAYLMTANSVVNPLLYAAVNDDFKLAFRSSINRLRRWFYSPKLFFRNVFQSSSMHDDVRLTQSMLLTTPQPPPQSLVED